MSKETKYVDVFAVSVSTGKYVIIEGRCQTGPWRARTKNTFLDVNVAGSFVLKNPGLFILKSAPEARNYRFVFRSDRVHKTREAACRYVSKCLKAEIDTEIDTASKQLAEHFKKYNELMAQLVAYDQEIAKTAKSKE